MPESVLIVYNGVVLRYTLFSLNVRGPIYRPAADVSLSKAGNYRSRMLHFPARHQFDAVKRKADGFAAIVCVAVRLNFLCLLADGLLTLIFVSWFADGIVKPLGGWLLGDHQTYAPGD